MDLYRNRRLQVTKDEELCFPFCDDEPSFRIYLSPPPPFWRRSSSRPPPPPVTQNPSDSSAFVILGITFVSLGLLFLACALYSKYKQSRSAGTPNPSPNPNNGPHIPRAGFDPAVIATIAAVKYQKHGGFVKSAECSVCLSEFQEDEALRPLPKCRHAFHVACIDTWLLSHTSCPVCRAPVILPPEEDPRPPVVPANESYGGESSDGGLEEAVGERVVGPCRRSVSLGFLEAKEIEMIIELRGHNRNSNNCGKKLRRMRSEHVSSSSSPSVKRSSSCNGKFVLCSPIRVMD